MTQQPKQLTSEVMAALKQQAALRGDDPPAAPDGQVRYHIAVEQHLHQGVADPTSVAAILRSIADHLDNTEPEENTHG